jgi:hypothetical protein
MDDRRDEKGWAFKLQIFVQDELVGRLRSVADRLGRGPI